ncbi:urate hydroxylase PuuD [Frateuria aurantia]
MAAYGMEVIGFLLRWFHVVAAMAWIGESFYFVALDQGLRTPTGHPQRGVSGESWSVHGGGFYHKQKYLVAPAVMPTVLHWSKWKAYTTWLSGFALFGGLYLSQPQLYLIDPSVRALEPALAVAAALALLLGGWLVYDGICRLLGQRNGVIGVLLALWMLAIDYAACHLFSGRAAWLLVGAVMATIMSANVFFVIIPGQRRMVAAMQRGETPDPVNGLRGKQRSVHNTYLTLPVVFAMLSNHFASAYAHADNWAILALIMLGGALIRQFFVLYHAGRRAWWLPACGTLAVLAALLWAAPRPLAAPAAAAPPGTTVEAPLARAPADRPVPSPAIMALLKQRCGACHSSHPSMMASAPRNLDFEQPRVVQMHDYDIYNQSAVLRIMPLGNVTHMTDDERAQIASWYQSNIRATRSIP